MKTNERCGRIESRLGSHRVWLLAVAFTVAGASACSAPDDAAHTVAFHGEQQAFPGFSFDTGYLPAGSPVQVRIQLNAAGGNSVDARATRGGSSDAPTLVGNAGSGVYTLGAHFTFQVLLKINIMGPLGRGIMYEGPIQGAPNIDFAFGGNASFDPFLVGGRADVHAMVPETMLVTIPLAGAVPVPGIGGDLTINIAGTVNSSFTGVCASAGGAGRMPEYIANTISDANLILRPVVHLQALSLMRTLEPFDIPVNIPSLTAPITINVPASPSPDAGPAGMSGGGSMAQSMACGGEPDAGMTMDAMPTDATTTDDATVIDDVTTTPDGTTTSGGLFSACAAAADCAALGANAQCLTFFPTGLCTVSCSADADCPSQSRCYNNTCRPPCESGLEQCNRYGGVCSDPNGNGSMMCVASCFPSGTTPPAGYPSCPASAACVVNSPGCGTAAPTGAGAVGAPCTTADDCASGACYPEVFDGAATGYIGGYCIGFARQPSNDVYQPGQPLPRSNCPPNSVAIPLGGPGDETYCFASCTNSSACRNGYGCIDPYTGVTPTGGAGGVCLPVDCSMTGMTCPSGYNCVTSTTTDGVMYGTCAR